MSLLHFRRANIAATTLTAIIVALSTWSLIETLRYSLPFPSAIPLANIAIALIALTSSWFINETTLSKLTHRAKTILNMTTYIIHFLPIILAALSSTYILPNDILACRTDTKWREMFMAKDGDTIRLIQSRLQCCGFNSMRDRAWPFPSALHGIDAGTCERTSGFADHCASRWQGQLVIATGLCVLASLLEQALLVLIGSGITQNSWSAVTGTQTLIRDRDRDRDERAGLLGSTEDYLQSTYAEEGRREMERNRPQV